jgi:hypothetical protein
VAVASAVERSTLAALFLNEVPGVELALPSEFANPLGQLERWRETFSTHAAAAPEA